MTLTDIVIDFVFFGLILFLLWKFITDFILYYVAGITALYKRGEQDKDGVWEDLKYGKTKCPHCHKKFKAENRHQFLVCPNCNYDLTTPSKNEAKKKPKKVDVFTRTEKQSHGKLISVTVYNLVIGLVLSWGFFINWLMVKYLPFELFASSSLIWILLYFGCCFLGVYLFTKSDNPFVSFFGYNLIVIPFGFVINLVVHRYDPALVLDAVRVTGLVTVVMMMAGSLFPSFFQKISGTLLVALLGVIAIELVEIFIFGIHHGFLDWAVAVIFCGYIGLDWSRANRIPKTFDNAVDSAASLYMDIINLFLRMLRIMGRMKR